MSKTLSSALIYQGCNMLVFLCLSVVPIVLGLPLVTMIAVVAAVGAGTALLGVTLDDVGRLASRRRRLWLWL